MATMNSKNSQQLPPSANLSDREKEKGPMLWCGHLQWFGLDVGGKSAKTDWLLVMDAAAAHSHCSDTAEAGVHCPRCWTNQYVSMPMLVLIIITMRRKRRRLKKAGCKITVAYWDFYPPADRCDLGAVTYIYMTLMQFLSFGVYTPPIIFNWDTQDVF